MMALADAERVEPGSRSDWRAWLQAHHAASTGAWVVYPKKSARLSGPRYEELVEEALCYGWIDSTVRAVDAERTSQYFSPRRRGSIWAASNKARVDRLIAQGLMTPAGMDVIERAQADGSWTLLDRAEALIPPDELVSAFDAHPGSRAAFEAFPANARKRLIFWVDSAKRPQTRQQRADEIAARAQQGIIVGQPASDDP